MSLHKWMLRLDGVIIFIVNEIMMISLSVVELAFEVIRFVWKIGKARLLRFHKFEFIELRMECRSG